MKSFQKICACLTAMLCILSLCAFGMKAQDEPSYTISISNAVQDATYTAYRLFDASYNASTGSISYTITPEEYNASLIEKLEACTKDDGLIYKADTNEIVIENESKAAKTIQSIIDELDPASAQTPSALKDYPATSKTASKANLEDDNNTLVLNVDAPGYYYIYSDYNPGGRLAVTLTSAAPSATVVQKDNVDPSSGENKDIKTWDESQSHNRGDQVDYTIQFTAYNQVTKELTQGNITSHYVQSYIITDVSSGLAIDTSTLKITVNEEEIEVSEDMIETKQENDQFIMTVTLDWLNKYPSKSEVIVTYTATIQTTQAIPNAVNQAKVSYVLTDGDPDNPDVINPDDEEVEIKTYTLSILKYDASDKSKVLKDAQFELLDANKNALEVYEVKDTQSSIPTYSLEKPSEEASPVFITTNASGQALIIGLQDVSADEKADYYLKETQAPKGYNLLESETAIYVGAYKAKENDSYVSKDTDSTVDVDVPNKKGGTLPSTGGIGTTIFYIAGGCLMIGCLIYLLTSRKMNVQ